MKIRIQASGSPLVAARWIINGGRQECGLPPKVWPLGIPPKNFMGIIMETFGPPEDYNPSRLRYSYKLYYLKESPITNWEIFPLGEGPRGRT
jgi:hypothetical protein